MIIILPGSSRLLNALGCTVASISTANFLELALKSLTGVSVKLSRLNLWSKLKIPQQLSYMALIISDELLPTVASESFPLTQVFQGDDLSSPRGLRTPCLSIRTSEPLMKTQILITSFQAQSRCN